MISKRAEVYARALFALCPENELLDQLQELAHAFKEEEKSFFLSPLVSRQEKKQIVKDSLEGLPPLVRNFLFVLIDRKALALLPQITEAFKKLLNESLRQEEGHVISKEPLPLEEKTRLEAALKPFFKKTVRLEQQTAPFIGGFYIKAGDYVFNDTIQFHLKKFQGG